MIPWAASLRLLALKVTIGHRSSLPMPTLDQIPVRAGSKASGSRHNALPILHEIRHAMERLASTGEPTILDLRSIPFSPGDQERLLGALGQGEVRATVDALGPTQVWETAYAGVWVLDYYSPEGERIAFQIEVTELPQLLRADRQDINMAAQRLDADLRDLED